VSRTGSPTRTTEIAVISLSGVVHSRSEKVAGNEMDEAITQYIKRKYNLLIGERTAEQIKIEIGSAYPLEQPRTMEIKGRDLMEGVPKSVTVSDEEIQQAALEEPPPQILQDPQFQTEGQFDLNKYVVGQTLNGLFLMLGEEEKKIRKDPAAQTTALLKEVFGRK